MAPDTFAAAQARLLVRRQQREASLRARQADREAAFAARLSEYPRPVQRAGTTGLSIWDTIKGRDGTRPAFRVGQVDAELLDEELLELLKGQVGEALKYFGTHLQTDWSAEIALILRAALFKLTVWDHDASYGASLQGLRYTDSRQQSLARPPPTMKQKSVYGLVTVLGRYGWTKWENHLLDAEGGYDEPSPLIKRLSKLTNTFSTVHSLTALASFLTFLYNGRYRTLLDRFLHMRLVPSSSHTSREVSFEYLNRQLVWHAFTEFLLFLLPLVGISRWRRILNRTWRKALSFFRRTFTSSPQNAEDEDLDLKTGELGFLPERTCAICYHDQNGPPANSQGDSAEMMAATAGGGVIGSASTDITNPYETIPCGCIYCFVCLAQRIEAEEGEGWTCLRCGEVVKECKPWNGDVVEEQPRQRHSDSSNGKSVGFSDSPENGQLERGRGRTIEPESGYHSRTSSYQASLRDVEPAPTESSTEERVHEEIGQHARALDTSALGDSAEWARVSEFVDRDEGFGHIGSGDRAFTTTETTDETRTTTEEERSPTEEHHARESSEEFEEDDEEEEDEDDDEDEFEREMRRRAR